jgi:hypothetical protein
MSSQLAKDLVLDYLFELYGGKAPLMADLMKTSTTELETSAQISNAQASALLAILIADREVAAGRTTEAVFGVETIGSIRTLAQRTRDEFDYLGSNGMLEHEDLEVAVSVAIRIHDHFVLGEIEDFEEVESDRRVGIALPQRMTMIAKSWAIQYRPIAVSDLPLASWDGYSLKHVRSTKTQLSTEELAAQAGMELELVRRAERDGTELTHEQWAQLLEVIFAAAGWRSVE